MDILTLVAVAVLVVAWVTWLTRTVRSDGLGHRPPPPSHHAAEADSHLRTVLR
jgi:hypothetical protein